MDPLAHTLVGATLAASGLRRRTPLATAALVVGANLPDVDGFVYFGGGADLGLWCRRGWTHGVLALVLWPFILTGALLLWERLVRRRRVAEAEAERARPWALLFLSTLAIVTHPTLDWLNTYGMRWLMPFDGRWFYGDALYIVDPWLWLVLGGALFLAGIRSRAGRATFGVGAAAAAALVVTTGRAMPPAARLVWIGGVALVVALRLARRPIASERAGERLARIALAITAAYCLAMLGASVATRRAVRAELARLGPDPVSPGALMAGPMPANPFAWDIVAETPAGYRYGRYDWLAEPRLTLSPRILPRPSETPVIAAARAAPSVRGLVNWARFPYYEVEEDAGCYVVYIMDARYTRDRTRGFGGAAVRLDRSLAPVTEAR